VQAWRDGDTLVLSVIDSGAGIDAAAGPAAGSSFGLQQVRERLAGLYGARATLDLQALPEGGTLARIRMPLSP
jgi:signal transduction histidine kinase